MNLFKHCPFSCPSNLNLVQPRGLLHPLPPEAGAGLGCQRVVLLNLQLDHGNICHQLSFLTFHRKPGRLSGAGASLWSQAIPAQAMQPPGQLHQKLPKLPPEHSYICGC